MNYALLKFLISILVITSFCACTNQDTNEPFFNLSGKIEKGPFLRGGSVTIQALNDLGEPTNQKFTTNISDNAGSYTFSDITLDAPIYRLTASGRYYNEVSGTNTSGTLHLEAITDMKNKTNFNVNILTHLKSARIQKLMHDGVKFTQADKQAQNEVLSIFGLQAYESSAAESISLNDGTDGSGVLLAISSLILSDRSDSKVNQYLSALSQDIADDGEISEEHKQTIVYDICQMRDKLSDLTSNITNYYKSLDLSAVIPDLVQYYDWDNDGTAGNETVDSVKVSLSTNELTFDKDGGTTNIQVTSNIPLFANPAKEPTSPSAPSSGLSLPDYFMTDSGDPIKIECSLENNILTIKVDKTKRRFEQTGFIQLTDKNGIIRASVKITLKGDNSVPCQLSSDGEQVVSVTYNSFIKAIAWIYYTECGYTGLAPFNNVTCPMTATDPNNNRAFTEAYSVITNNTQIIKALIPSNITEASSFFTLLNAIIYTEMVDKWERIGISELSNDPSDIPTQENRDSTLRYLEKSLQNISDAFTEKKGITNADPKNIFEMSKDVWRVAIANVYMSLNEPSKAIPYLQEIADSKRYMLDSGISHGANDNSILHISIPQEVVAGDKTLNYYSYAEVLLTLAECHLATGNTLTALSLINRVSNSRGTNESSINDIYKLRQSLLLPRYFSFQKRHQLGDYAPIEYCWPIPANQLTLSPTWVQNPGY